jgi:hypothetical protein
LPTGVSVPLLQAISAVASRAKIIFFIAVGLFHMFRLTCFSDFRLAPLVVKAKVGNIGYCLYIMTASALSGVPKTEWFGTISVKPAWSGTALASEKVPNHFDLGTVKEILV